MKRKHSKLMLTLSGVALGMFAFGFAMVPLYDVFCEFTGLRFGAGGTGRKALDEVLAEQTLEERWVTVTFEAEVDRGLPWQFTPKIDSMRVQIGALSEAYYFATNDSHQNIVGHAVPSIAPAEASLYFAKTECFCFTEQLLAAGETRDMGVRFMIDSQLPDDIKIMTLSYRFYRNVAATERLVDSIIDRTRAVKL